MIEPAGWLSRVHAEASGPGDAPAVLLLHGWGSSAALMRPLARMLDDRHRYIKSFFSGVMPALIVKAVPDGASFFMT